MKCALCHEREANKRNTHYLTDGIIRTCLNIDGSNDREKGFYFDLSNSAYIDFNFQRETSVEKLKESMGRIPTDEEVERAKQIPFSVNNVFCNVCEEIFTSIESAFIKYILPKFRNSDIKEIDKLEILEVKNIRLFFYLQIWRAHICEDTYSLTKEVSEALRQIILYSETVTASDIKHFPIAISYLETLGDMSEYTSNFVGTSIYENPYLIFMNDFIIQFYDSNESIHFFDFYDLNSKNEFNEFINFEENNFSVKIIHDAKRKEILNNIIRGKIAKPSIQFYQDSFIQLWKDMFGVTPPIRTLKEYISAIAENDEFKALQYTPNSIIKLTREFIIEKLKSLRKN